MPVFLASLPVATMSDYDVFDFRPDVDILWQHWSHWLIIWRWSW